MLGVTAKQNIGLQSILHKKLKYENGCSWRLYGYDVWQII